MTTDSLIVLNLPHPLKETVESTQRSIARELSAGRDVVVVMESACLKRAERLLLARPAISLSAGPNAVRSGRLAIVSEGAAGAEFLPPEFSNHVRCFENMDSAVRWLRPLATGPLGRTVRYITRPVNLAGSGPGPRA